MEVNTIYCGDCLEILKKFPANSVDLIYADPPFFSGRHYGIIWKDGAEKRAFGDRWKGGINHYIRWIVPRLEQCQRILKKTGSFYIHCDWHASHHLKVALDKIFGGNNFRNEIIWKRSTGHPLSIKKLESITDTILVYGKSKDVYFSPFPLPLDEKVIERDYKNKDEHGRYQNVDLTGGKGGGKEAYEPFKGVLPPKGRAWAPPRREKLPQWAVKKLSPKYEKMNQLEKCKELDRIGLIYWSKKKKPRFKRYLPENPTRFATNLWDDIKSISSQSNERLGYPTQKPLDLLKRIIKISSKKGNIVLDPFCGCGTTLVAAHKLKRKWIGIDVSPTACKLMQRRIRDRFSITSMILGGEITIKHLKKMKPFEFQNWVCAKLFGRVSDRKSSDMGIDGYTLDGRPIQVKQSERVGRNVIDNFETAVRRKGKKKGIVVGFSFVKSAHEEAARAKVEGDLDIQLITAEELLKRKKK